jgi:rhodanese-related sulfurtransferase
MRISKFEMLSGVVITALALFCVAYLSHAAQKDSQSQQANADSNSGQKNANAKDALPYPDVPRIKAEEVEKLIKEKGNVVLVDTDDSEAYADEHIKSAVNITYDPTTDAREADQSLSVLPGDKLIVFYCNCPHEEDAAPFVQEMWNLGYDKDKVKALQGGLTRWEQLRYPLAGTSVSSPPVQRGN